MDYQESKITTNGHVAIHNWEPVTPDGYHKSSVDIEDEIVETRHSMDIIMDTLGKKFKPHSLIEQLVEIVQKPEHRTETQNMAIDMGKKVFNSVQNNPLPALLIGTGLAWLAYQNKQQHLEKIKVISPETQSEKSTQAVSEKAQNLKETLSSGLNETKERLQTGKEKLFEKVEKGREKKDGISEKLKSGIQEQQQKGNDLQNKTTESTGKAASSVSGQIRGNPLGTGFAFGLFGILAGMLLPSTQQLQKPLEQSKHGDLPKEESSEKKIFTEKDRISTEGSVVDVTPDVQRNIKTHESFVKKPFTSSDKGIKNTDVKDILDTLHKDKPGHIGEKPDEK
jgi:ElaB/YqjD/DUF883 family membrane-anchored ribosome-binding protein